MKVITLAVFAASMMVSGLASADIKIKGSNEQRFTAKKGVIVANTAIGESAKAKQNIASNQGNVEILGTNKQIVDVGDYAIIANTAIGKQSVAIQNIASNSSATE